MPATLEQMVDRRVATLEAMDPMSLERNLRAMERTRESYWRRYPATSPVKLRWRALTVRHCFHVLPGESILELGAGSGLWTAHLAEMLARREPDHRGRVQPRFRDAGRGQHGCRILASST